MQILKLTSKQVRSIYRLHLTSDFPADEVKPLFMILRAMRAGKYDCFGLLEGCEILGYAFFVRHGCDFLLDYLAIVDGQRNRGYGSGFLAGLRSQIPDAASILAEVEDPDTAETSEVCALRAARLRFYLRCGFADSGIRVNTFGVDYRLLEMPLPTARQPQEVLELYLAHYREMLPKKLFDRMIKV